MKYILILIIAVGALVFMLRDQILPTFFMPRQSDSAPTENRVGITSPDSQDIEIVVQNLNIPWEVAFLPNGDMLVTEREGRLLKVGADTKIIQEIEGVAHIGEGGLLGMAIHPNFAQNSFLYLYSTTRNGAKISNRVERYLFTNDTLTDRRVILENINGSIYHDGGRIAFGPDGYLYITTGDAQSENSSQDKNSLNGKILRITYEGKVPSDNPFGNEIYAFGLRNPQGLAWDSDGRLWVTEHGPSGPQTGHDELNLIEKGGNYGWPMLKGDETRNGFIAPVIQSGSNDTWAPSGMAYLNGSLFFTGLRGEALYQARILSEGRVELITHLKQEFGRLRAVVVGPDGFLYVSTSNTDGRGTPNDGDDKILKVNPEIFNYGNN